MATGERRRRRIAKDGRSMSPPNPQTVVSYQTSPSSGILSCTADVLFPSCSVTRRVNSTSDSSMHSPPSLVLPAYQFEGASCSSRPTLKSVLAAVFAAWRVEVGPTVRVRRGRGSEVKMSGVGASIHCEEATGVSCVFYRRGARTPVRAPRFVHRKRQSLRRASSASLPSPIVPQRPTVSPARSITHLDVCQGGTHVPALVGAGGGAMERQQPVGLVQESSSDGVHSPGAEGGWP